MNKGCGHPNEPIRLVVGLGNVGREYEATRHNAGFWFVDALAALLGATLHEDKKLFGAVGKAGELRLLKPSTYMNRSGQAVAALAHFYQVPTAQILVAHDELDLPPGEVKLKFGGGHAGHNGLRDIHAKLSPDYWRLRIGIGHPRDSANPLQPVVDWVLQRPLPDQRQAIDAAIARALVAWAHCAAGRMAEATKAIHTKPTL